MSHSEIFNVPVKLKQRQVTRIEVKHVKPCFLNGNLLYSLSHTHEETTACDVCDP